MSASTETLIEQIKLTEELIATTEAAGRDTSVYKTDLRHLQRRLQAASEALTEGRQILKD